MYSKPFMGSFGLIKLISSLQFIITGPCTNTIGVIKGSTGVSDLWPLVKGTCIHENFFIGILGVSQ